MKILMKFMFLAVLILAGCSGGKSTPVTLTSITVIPANSSIAPGTTSSFSATGKNSDGTLQNLTSTVTWSSSDSTIATINSSGKVTAGSAPGQTTISAVSGSITGSVTLTVSAVTAVAVTPVNPRSIFGTTRQFTATGTLANLATQNLTSFATWSSDTTGVATISTGGLTTAVSAGSAIISAAFGGSTGSSTLAVDAAPASITVTPANPTIATGSTQKFTATGTLSDNSTQDISTLVAWTSSDPTVATIVSNNGLASALAAGQTSITATLGVTGSTLLKVNSLTSIAITPAAPSVGVGSTMQLVATGTFSDSSVQNLTSSVTWASSNAAVASVSNNSGTKGLITGVGAGTCNLTATSGSIIGTIPVTITAKQASFAYVTNSGSNTLSVVDTATNTVVNSIVVGSTPQGVALNTSTGLIYVANSLSNSVSVIDSNSNNLTTTISSGLQTPTAVAVNPTTNRLYVINSSGNSVSIFNTTDNSLLTTIQVGTTPQDIAIDVTNNLVYVTNSVVNSVSVIDVTANTVTPVAVGTTPKGLALNASINRLYVANSGSGSVSVINTLTNAVAVTVPVGTTPTGVAVDAAAGRVYVSNRGSNTVSVIDTTSNTVVATISVGTAPQGIAVNHSTSRAYVVNSGSNSISIIDTSVNSVLTTTTVGVTPTDIALFQ